MKMRADDFVTVAIRCIAPVIPVPVEPILIECGRGRLRSSLVVEEISEALEARGIGSYWARVDPYEVLPEITGPNVFFFTLDLNTDGASVSRLLRVLEGGDRWFATRSPVVLLRCEETLRLPQPIMSRVHLVTYVPNPQLWLTKTPPSLIRRI